MNNLRLNTAIGILFIATVILLFSAFMYHMGALNGLFDLRQNPQLCASRNHDCLMERELAAQVASAEAAFWTNVVSGVQALISALGLFWVYHSFALTRISVKAALDAVQIAEKNFRLENRPWVLLRGFQLAELSCKGNTVSGKILFLVKNIGKSPAIDVRVYAKLYNGTTPDTYIDSEMVRIPDDQLNVLRAFVLMPGDDTPEERVCVVDLEGDVSVAKVLKFGLLFTYRSMLEDSDLSGFEIIKFVSLVNSQVSNTWILPAESYEIIET